VEILFSRALSSPPTVIASKENAEHRSSSLQKFTQSPKSYSPDNIPIFVGKAHVCSG
jgi:hypothetical protein